MIVLRIRSLKGGVYFLVVLLLLSILSLSVFAEVVVFKQYDTKNFLDDGKLRVEKNIRITNGGTNPIIPGELHFKVYEFEGKDQVASQIENLYAHNNQNKLTANVIKKGDYSDIVVDVWNPLLPDFEVPITITYDLLYKQKGVLFHELNFPVEETTVPISSSSIKLYLPKNFYVTYAPNAEISDTDMYKVVEWDDTEKDLTVEYTRLPLPKMMFRFSTMFWLVVITILLGVTVYFNFFYKKKKK